MKIKECISVLLENGIKPKTISKWGVSEIRVLAERFIGEAELKIDPKKPEDLALAKSKGLADAAGKITIPMTEDDELSEKFESKAQQGLFWAKCNNSKGKTKEKWCKMAKEFSDDTTKKDYKKMPDKKHPEKTTKTTKESYEMELENKIVNMVEKYVNPTMTKGMLLKTLNEKKESFMLNKPKKNTMFSENEGMEMKKSIRDRVKFVPKGEFGEQTTAPTKPGTKEREKTKTPTRRKGNPFKDPNPGVKEQPKAEEQKNKFMSALTSILNK